VSVPVIDSSRRDVENMRNKRLSYTLADNMTYGGHPPPNLYVPYSVTIKDKMSFCAITMMKVRCFLSRNDELYDQFELKKSVEISRRTKSLHFHLIRLGSLDS